MRTTRWNAVGRGLAMAALAAACGSLHAAPAEWDGLSISKIRAVGDYNGSDTTFDNTIEIWLTSPPALPSGVSCTVNFRVYVNAANKHMVAAAYLAMSTGKKINVYLDDTALPIRSGACEASWVDVLN